MACAYGINPSGVAVGYADVVDANSTHHAVAVRWDAAGTPTTLTGGFSPQWVNATGTAVSYSGALWDGSSTAATQLHSLGLDQSGREELYVRGLNNAGVAVGEAYKYVGGQLVSGYAARWDAGSTTPAVLSAPLGDEYPSFSEAMSISQTGVIAGYCYSIMSDTAKVGGATIWQPDGTAIDFNKLIDPNSGWRLDNAVFISPNGQWVAGSGWYVDPSNPVGYNRLWLMQVPEPATLALLALTASALLARRRR
jgi:hypothetical protein